MRSVVVSDLHLGARSDRDVLRLAEPRRRLAEFLDGADQVVLLGDVVELRGLPASQSLGRSGTALRELGEAIGDARVVVVPGNHDHRLAGEWIEARRQSDNREPLSLAAELRPVPGGLAQRLAEALGASDLVLSYPGLWLRPDVFATHGHYLDAHNTVPTLEAIAISVTERIAGGLPAGRLSPSDYEGVVAPIYAFDYELAQGLEAGRGLWGTGASLGIWKRLRPEGGRGRIPLQALAGLGMTGATAGLKRAGLRPFRPDLSPTEIRRAALTALGTVVDRLGVEAAHVIFGHTHRAGPLPGDSDADGWLTSGGTRLVNSGCWVREPALIRSRGSRSPYWPGTSVVVEDDGPPRLERLLGDLRPEQLAM